jgi:hypothetical protein
MSTREHILGCIEGHPSLQLRVQVAPRDNCLVVFKLDDGTETGRIIRGAPTWEHARKLLANPPPDYCTEHLIDLTAKSLHDCVYRAYSGYRNHLEIDGRACDFDADEVIFA